MVALILAAVIAVSASPSGSSLAPITMTSAPGNKCVRRVLCGPLHLLPSDRFERRAFVARLALQLLDGIVTAAGLRAGRGSYVPLEETVHCANCAKNYIDTSWSRPGGTAEADILVAPFSHGGLVSLLAGGLAFDVVSAAATRRWSAISRASLDLDLAGSHFAGISSWAPLFAARRATDAAYAKCASAVADVGTGGGGPTSVLLIGSNVIAGGIQAARPTHECSNFTPLPISIIGSL